jgi:hypothetical protein
MLDIAHPRRPSSVAVAGVYPLRSLAELRAQDGRLFHCRLFKQPQGYTFAQFGQRVFALEKHQNLLFRDEN